MKDEIQVLQAETKSGYTWYRSPVSRQDLKRLSQRSDFKGYVQTLGYLGLLMLTGTATMLAVGRAPWPMVLLLLYFHGTCSSFLTDAHHELLHNSVFKTRSLNMFFTRVVGFLGWQNHHHFWSSHSEHHKFTLHPPDDQEVLLPAKLTLGGFLNCTFLWVNSHYILQTIRYASGRIQGEWEYQLFPESEPERRRQLFNWSRLVLLSHIAISAVALLNGWWMFVVVFSLTPFYAGGLCYLLNHAQHAGLKDNVEDYRVCCRTIILNHFFEFIYWHMNYHTEHHMYAAVPCYNLRKLHALIKDDLPPCPHGVFATWGQIIDTIQRQKKDPNYTYMAPLP